MGVVIQVQRVRFSHEAMKRALKSRRPLNVGDARCCCGLFFVQLRSFPNRQFFIGLNGEQNLAIRRVVCLRKQHQNGCFLVNTRQPQNITGLLERQSSIRTGGVDVV